MLKELKLEIIDDIYEYILYKKNYNVGLGSISKYWEINVHLSFKLKYLRNTSF